MEKYRSWRLFWFSVFLTVLRACNAFESLFLIFEIWNLNERDGSKKTPRNLTAGIASSVVILRIAFTCSAKFWPSLLLSHTNSMSCLAVDLVNRIKFVLSGWRTILIILKNSQIFGNSVFTSCIKVLISSWDRSRVRCYRQKVRLKMLNVEQKE